MRRDELKVASIFEPEQVQVTEAQSLDVPAMLRRIGRGRIGARDLLPAEATLLFQEIFENRVSPAVVGAALMALRVKGETANELLGALAAAQARTQAIPTDPLRPVVSIPSYNGARNLPNLVWLLACLVARQGVQVIIHGMSTDHDQGKRRTRTEEVVKAFGTRPLADLAQARSSFEQNLPVYVPLRMINPSLASLIQMREELGVRNTGHSLVKMLNPTDRSDCLRISCFTHQEFDELQHEVFSQLKVPALISRGAEGEVVTNLRKPGAIDFVHRGTTIPAFVPLSDTASGQGFGSWSNNSIFNPGVNVNLPHRTDITATVEFTVAVLAGAQSVPLPMLAQVDAIVQSARFAFEFDHHGSQSHEK